MKYNENNFVVVGDHCDLRNCIKGYSIGKVQKHGLRCGDAESAKLTTVCMFRVHTVVFVD